jgi:hypothetical protein
MKTCKKSSLRGIQESIYPGYVWSPGFVENLSSYREDFELFEGALINPVLAFDIERVVSWDRCYNLLPFKYSMMIDVYYTVSRLRKETRPTREGFRKKVSRLDGFILEEDRNDMNDKSDVMSIKGLLEYTNLQKNVFTNWSINTYNSMIKRDKICVGVIQKTPVSELSPVLKDVVPYAVSVFNQLSPERKLDEAIVEESIKVALESDKILPKCRIRNELSETAKQV